MNSFYSVVVILEIVKKVMEEIFITYVKKQTMRDCCESVIFVGVKLIRHYFVLRFIIFGEEMYNVKKTSNCKHNFNNLMKRVSKYLINISLIF